MNTMTQAAPATKAATIAEHEALQVERANATGLQPVVFVHGLWLLLSSWDRWAAVFEDAGFVALTPGWPDDPDTVEEAHKHPEDAGIAPLAQRWRRRSLRSCTGFTLRARRFGNG